MMMETAYDPYELLFGDVPRSPVSDSLLFPHEVMLGNFNADSSSISPTSDSMDNTEPDFDPTAFEKLINDLLSSDPTMIQEQSIDLPLTSFESELEPPTRREMGTDPMEPMPSTRPLIINAATLSQLTGTPIFLIQKPAYPTADTTEPLPTEYINVQIDTSASPPIDHPMEEVLPLTPSTSSESPDEGNSNSPDSFQDNSYSKLLTNFDNLPRAGPLVLTNEETKLIKQEGYQVPTKLPLSKAEEKMLKKIRRKIKNKISAQESRRKKKEYVDALEQQIAKYVEENNVLKARMTAVEKNHKSLAKERDLLRSMLNKATPAPSKALMVFAVFFAVLFGIWSPITSKSSFDDRALSLENPLMPANNHQAAFVSEKSIFDQQDMPHSSHLADGHKSRVLLSVDEYDTHHHHGPYLPSSHKTKSSIRQEAAAPGYTYSNSVEKYMNKKVYSADPATGNNKWKRSLSDDSSSVIFTQKPVYKKVRSDYHVNEEMVVLDETDGSLNESKPMKIIRVERTVPAIGNDTLKLAHRTGNE